MAHLLPGPQEPTTNDRYQLLVTRWASLAKFSAGFKPSRIPLDPYPSDITALNDDLLALAREVDALIAEYGRYLNANVSGLVEHKYFTNRLTSDIEGNATACVDEAAKQLADDMADAAA